MLHDKLTQDDNDRVIPRNTTELGKECPGHALNRAGERHSPFANAWPRVPFKGPRFKSGFLRVTHQVTLCPLLEGVAAAFKALSTLVAPIHLRPEKSPQESVIAVDRTTRRSTHRQSRVVVAAPPRFWRQKRG